MESIDRDLSDKESSEQKASNTEWLPTKCRITKPPPPKPATNPLQFIKVAPCPLFQKAHEQIKKVEEIKVMRQESKDEPEDWQQNLDNWKSSRRKRHEHIIERVVEVKKLVQEEQQRGRRKSKTFSEILEDRDKRGHRVTIPIYDDDINDLSDYGIGSSSSKANSIKDVDTDDSSTSNLEEKYTASSDSPINKDLLRGPNQSQSDEELVAVNVDKENNLVYSKSASSNLLKNSSSFKKSDEYISKILSNDKNEIKQELPQYTYQGAIEDYRSRIRCTKNVNDSVLDKDIEKSKEQKSIPKIDVIKRKAIFSFEKPMEISHFETNTSRRLSEDFVNSQSIKDRLKSLEKCAEQPIISLGKSNLPKQSIKNKEIENDCKNNNVKYKYEEKSVKDNSTSNLLLDSGGSSVTNKSDVIKNDVDCYSSLESELYMNKLNDINRDLNSFIVKDSDVNAEDCCNSITTSSNSFAELTGISSDREDSGIHTADVSCSVSQADEPIEDTDMSIVPSCIEKLNQTTKLITNDDCHGTDVELAVPQQVNIDTVDVFDYKRLVDVTQLFLNDVCHHYDMGESVGRSSRNVNNHNQQIPNIIDASNNYIITVQQSKDKSVVYENIEIKNFDVVDDNFLNSTFPLTPTRQIEPPKEKPPPPPPIVDNATLDESEISNIRRLNSTKRIKKEINIKRSSFLGLSESLDSELDIDHSSQPPPNINLFLKRESQMEKSLYKKLQGSKDICSSEVESQDSGLESERGRLSSDTWCSSYGESNTSMHGRQDSEQTNSVTSEEDEIAKKEREIIELIEKEEKYKGVYKNSPKVSAPHSGCNSFKKPSKFPNRIMSYQSNLSDDQDSEILKVEQELLQLEREEMERQMDNVLFRENHIRMYHQNNRRSLDNICDTTNSELNNVVNYRKSMPELQNCNDYRKFKPKNNHYYDDLTMGELYHKSMPNIQQAYFRSIPEYSKLTSGTSNNVNTFMDHRKSMPELLEEQISHPKSHQILNQQPIMPGKPVKSLIKEQREKERSAMMFKNNEFVQNRIRHDLLSVPKSEQKPSDKRIQSKVSLDNKNKHYNQHWLYQEAELRRLTEQQRNETPKRNAGQNKHIPEPIIQTLTQRIQNRALQNDRNQSARSTSKDYLQSHINNSKTFGHAAPVVYPPLTTLEDSQGKMLSVSGKKKCSYCGIELGRGAAMIIESLCLCYHMECFKCCVCHVQLGDGLMGTDVRVRNQKLHCHNCYSSDDGVKFSCV